MLESLRIENLGIIEASTVEFSEGMTAITGETGAGKTMLLTALNLLTGARAKGSMVKTGADRAFVEGIWTVAPQAFDFASVGAQLDDDCLFVNRSLTADGKSRGSLGGASVPAGTLKEVGAQLLSIHGQADQLKLRQAAAQRSALDSFAPKLIEPLVSKVRKAYKDWRGAKTVYDELSSNATTRRLEFESLKRFVEEVDELNPEANELEELEQLIDSLSNADSIREAVGAAQGILSPEDYEALGPLESFSQALSTLEKVASFSPALAEACEKLEALEEQVHAVESLLEDAAHAIDGEAIQRLYEAQDRELELKAFVKRYGGSLADILEQAAVARERLIALDPDANSLAILGERLEEAEADLRAVSAELTTARKEAAVKFMAAVNKELAALSMAGSVMSIVFTEEAYSPLGVDGVQFTLAAGKGQPGPITSVASGGELSRIMLAIEVVLSRNTVGQTFIFDEVDAGIGGKTAQAVAQRLAKLSQKNQVIVVTHLPQVAAVAERQILVEKSLRKGEVHTTSRVLSREERVSELARMLSGQEDSALALAHAEELLQDCSSASNDVK